MPPPEKQFSNQDIQISVTSPSVFATPQTMSFISSTGGNPPAPVSIGESQLQNQSSSETLFTISGDLMRAYNDELTNNDFVYRQELLKIEREHRLRTISALVSFFSSARRHDSNTLNNIQPAFSVSTATEGPSQVPVYRPIIQNGKNADISQHNSRVVVLQLFCNEYISALGKYCDVVVPNETKLREHLETAHGIRAFQCLSKDPNCQKRSFKKHSELQLHVNNYHNKRLQCKGANCKKVFTTSNGISRHFENVHRKGDFQCNKCSMVFNYISCFKNHKNCTSSGVKNNFLEPVRNLRSN